MDSISGFIDAVGNTPLIKLKRASELTGCNIYGKAEFLNPGGSVKDRAAKYMLLSALQSNLIEPGGLVIEGTAGNTGIGLALCGRSLDIRTHIYMPDTQSDEKKRILKISGANLFEIPAVPFSNPNHYVHTAERAAIEAKNNQNHGVFYANQWDNLANREGHASSTGPEIWSQTNEKIDGFICAIGTGGTVTGVGDFLKNKNKAKFLYNKEFVRMWECYLSMCSAAFKFKDLVVYQLQLVKNFTAPPSNRRNYIYQ